LLKFKKKYFWRRRNSINKTKSENILWK